MQQNMTKKHSLTPFQSCWAKWIPSLAMFPVWLLAKIPPRVMKVYASMKPPKKVIPAIKIVPSAREDALFLLIQHLISEVFSGAESDSRWLIHKILYSGWHWM